MVGGLLDLPKLLHRTRTGIEHQHNIDRLLDRRKKDDLLLHAILCQAELFPFQVWNIAILPVADDHGQSDEIGVDADRLTSRLLFLLRRNERGENDNPGHNDK